MHLPENLRSELKKPLGVLIPDFQVTKAAVKSYISKDAFVITVGDATTDKLVSYGINPSLQIVDSLEKRNKRDLPLGYVKTMLHCKNPAAQITSESIDGIKKALGMAPPVRLVIDGEEDLLVLPAVIHSPEGSVVLYGQPNEGLVIVQVTEEIKNKARKIMDMMSGE
ncbi:MAG: GTP-dependent dephospho-CoA kinase family protein [Nitrososphaera sp.]